MYCLQEGLSQQCAEAMMETINRATVCAYHAAATQYCEAQVQRTCLEYLERRLTSETTVCLLKDIRWVSKGWFRWCQSTVSQSITIQIDNSLIQPHLDYCSPIWDGLSNQTDELSKKLQKLQNHAARVTAKANYETSSNILLEMLKWDTLFIVRQKKQKAVMMFKPLNKLAPVYLQDLFNKGSTNYNSLNSCGKLTLPKPRINYLKCSFSYSRAQLWNSSPQDARNIKSIEQFKREINRLFQSLVSPSAILWKSEWRKKLYIF